MEAVEPVPHLLVLVPTCNEAMVPVLNIMVPVPQRCGVPVHFWYRYQHVISAGLEQNFNLGVRAHSSFDHHFEITNQNCI